jgi:hypothetical protein
MRSGHVPEELVMANLLSDVTQMQEAREAGNRERMAAFARQAKRRLHALFFSALMPAPPHMPETKPAQSEPAQSKED